MHSKRAIKLRTWLRWWSLGDRRCHSCGMTTMRLRQPVFLDEMPEYDRCPALQGGTWSGSAEIPHCVNKRGHDGSHSDEVVVRWQDPVVVTWPPPTPEEERNDE